MRCQSDWVTRAAGGAACWAVLTLRVADCSAQQSPVALEWDAPTRCPQSQDVQNQLCAIIGELANATQTNPLLAKGTIESVEDRFRLTLQIERQGMRGTRIIESGDCRSLGKAAAVVLGLVIRREKDLGRELSPSEMGGFTDQAPAPPVPPAPPAPPPEKKPEPVPASVPEQQRHGWFMLVLPTASVDVGTLPSSGFGAGAGVGVSNSRWRSSITGVLWAKQTTNAVLVPGSFDTEYKRRTLQATGCRDFPIGRLAFGPCVVIALDSVTAAASRAVASTPGSRLTAASPSVAWFSAGGGISGAWRLSDRVSVVAEATGRLALSRPVFALRGTPDDGSSGQGVLAYDTQVHRVPLVTLVSSLELEWIF